MIFDKELADWKFQDFFFENSKNSFVWFMTVPSVDGHPGQLGSFNHKRGLNWNEGLIEDWSIFGLSWSNSSIRTWTSSIWYHYVVTKCLQAGSFDFVSTQRKSFLFRDSFKIIPNKNSRKDFRSDTDPTTQSIQFSLKNEPMRIVQKGTKFRNFKFWHEFYNRDFSQNTIWIWPWASFRCFWLLRIIQWVPHVFLLW